MPKSKTIEDFFPVPLTSIRPNERLCFDLHLYFQQNQHIMLWRETGASLTPDFIRKYIARGITQVWLHKQDAPTFDTYQDPEGLEKEIQAAIGQGQPTPMEMAKQIGNAIKNFAKSPQSSDGKPDPQVKEEVESLAQELIRRGTAPSSPRSQNEINQQLRNAVEDILQSTLESTRSAVLSQVMELWKLAHIDPDFEHAVEVATFAVLFAMAFGRIDAALLGDLALAGLLHDVGISQVPASIVILPWKAFTPSQLAAYSDHVESSISLISEIAPEVPPRVRAIISQHHEKFDGSGYPNKLRGFKVDDIAQLLSISDILHSFATGQWDGVRRTLRETFDMLEQLEKSSIFPSFFNPDVFEAVIGWIRNVRAQEAKEAKDGAATVVSEQTLRMMGE